MRNAITKRLTVGFVAAAALSVSATASAQQHSYAVVTNPHVPAGDADVGGAVKIYTHDLLGSCVQFVNHEFWYGVDPGKFWVEVGFKNGLTSNGACVSPSIFWADNRNGGGYHEHYPGNSWTFDTWYQLWIGRGSNSCTWTVNIGSLQLGTSVSNCAGTGRDLAAGIEATSIQCNSSVCYLAKGFLGEFLRADNGGTWRSGWDGPVLTTTNPPNTNINWTDSGHTGTEETLNEAF